MILIMTNEAYIEALEIAVKSYVDLVDNGQYINGIYWFKKFKYILEMKTKKVVFTGGTLKDIEAYITWENSIQIRATPVIGDPLASILLYKNKNKYEIINNIER